MTMRLALATLAVITAPLSAQNADTDKPVEGGGKLPAGWSARADKDAAMTNVKFETMGRPDPRHHRPGRDLLEGDRQGRRRLPYRGHASPRPRPRSTPRPTASSSAGRT